MNLMFGNLPLVLATGGSIEIKDTICISYNSDTWNSTNHIASAIIEKMTKGVGWYYVFGAESLHYHSSAHLIAGLLYYDGSRIWGNLDGLYTYSSGYYIRYSYCGAKGDSDPNKNSIYIFTSPTSGS